jgi:hypothetical protein
MSQYREFRKDGWPFCPCCDEDELANPGFSVAFYNEHQRTPTVEEFLESGLICYLCNWHSSELRPLYPGEEMLRIIQARR